MFHQKILSSVIALSSTDLVVIRSTLFVRWTEVVHNCGTLQLMLTIFLHFDCCWEHLKFSFLFSGHTKSFTAFTEYYVNTFYKHCWKATITLKDVNKLSSPSKWYYKHNFKWSIKLLNIMVTQHKVCLHFIFWQMNGTYKIICLVILLIANIWMIKLLLNCTSVFKLLLATENTESLLLNPRRFYWGFKGYQSNASAFWRCSL